MKKQDNYLAMPVVYQQVAGIDRTDFYGLSKGWRIIFVIFFTPTHNGTNAMNQLVTSRINDKHLRLTLFKFASIIILEIPRHLDRRHGTQVD